MTKHEAHLLSAYTEILLTDFDSFHEFCQETLGRKVYTHEFSSKKIWDDIKENILDEVIKICEEAE